MGPPPESELDLHLHRLALPAPGDRRALQQLVGDLISAPLDRRKPLWEMHMIDGYGEGCVLLVRVHHCMADGITLAQALGPLVGVNSEVSFAPPAPPAANGARPAAARGRAVERLAAGRVRRLGGAPR